MKRTNSRMYRREGRKLDRIDTHNWWNRMKRNIIKRWQIIFVPMKKFFIPGGSQEEEPEEVTPPPAPEPEPIPEPVAQPVAEPEAEPEIDTSGMSQEDLDLANEIFARLQAEAAADEAVKQAEIDAAYAASGNESSYNATTNSYSGDYGTGPVDDDTADAVAQILKQNNRSGIDQ